MESLLRHWARNEIADEREHELNNINMFMEIGSVQCWCTAKVCFCLNACAIG